MVALIITTIAGALCAFNIITPDIFVAMAFASVLLEIIGTKLYYNAGLFKFFYHDILGWHTPDGSTQYSDGCSQHARCKYCGRDIMQDSQGNWFC